MKSLLLYQRGAGEDENGLPVEGSAHDRRRGAGRAGEPSLVLGEEFQHGLMVRGLIRLEVEVQGDQGPLVALIVFERLLDDGAHPFKEVVAHVGLTAIWLVAVDEEAAASAGGGVDVPSQVLLNGEGQSGLEGNFNAVLILAVVGIAVVGIEHHPIGGERGTGNQGQRKSHLSMIAT